MSEILKNILFIKEFAVPYYKEHNIPYEETNSELRSPLSVLITNIKQRKPGTPSITKKFKKI